MFRYHRIKQKSIINNNFIMERNVAIPPVGKIPYYRTDGTGRDSYIREHNGGLLSKDRIHSLYQFQAPKQRKMQFGKTSYNRHPTTYQQGGSNKFPHYISDGSGRDFYVKTTQGGNSCPFQWRNQTDYKFRSTLRKGDPHPNVNPQKIDIFAKTQMMSTSRVSKLTSIHHPIQRSLDSRLSEPKKGLKPPPIRDYLDKNFNLDHLTKSRNRRYYN